MSNYIILNRKKHLSVLADHRIDPVTKELLKVGDEVCACEVCMTIYSRKVWDSVKRKTCCDQKKTLSEIPNIEYIDFKKKTTEVTTNATISHKSYGCAFAFFLITTIGFIIATWYYYDSYEKELYESKMLNQSNNSLKQKNNSLTNEKEGVQNKLERMHDLSFRIGKLDATMPTGYDSKYLVFLKVNNPITLNHLYVQPKTAGMTIIKLYDFDTNRLIDSKSEYLYYSEQMNKIILNFNISKPGMYYLKQEGKIILAYHKSSAKEYQRYTNDALEITGTGTKKSNYKSTGYYQYFYDINYSLLFQ